jgi:hypothetical protein
VTTTSNRSPPSPATILRIVGSSATSKNSLLTMARCCGVILATSSTSLVHCRIGCGLAPRPVAPRVRSVTASAAKVWLLCLPG